jgi:hypothetical protein
LKQGQNIAEAVLTILDTTLDVFIFSTLSAAKRISGGKYTKVYHFDAKAKVIDDIEAFHPDLAKKTAAIQLGFSADNWRRPTPIQPTMVCEIYIISPKSASTEDTNSSIAPRRHLRDLRRRLPGRASSVCRC